MSLFSGRAAGESICSRPTAITYWTDRREHEIHLRFQSGPRELYDLAADPFEHNNLSSDPAYAALMGREKLRLQAWTSFQNPFYQPPRFRSGLRPILGLPGTRKALGRGYVAGEPYHYNCLAHPLPTH